MSERIEDMPDERVLEATKDHWLFCACSWCAELARRLADN